MADNKVKFLRGTSAEYEAKTKDNDTFYYTTDTKKLYLGETEITSIEIDDTSTTATDKTWSAKKISNSIPTELPANGGNADTLAGNSIDNFLKYNGVATDCNECTTRGVYQANSSTLNIPSGVHLSSLHTPVLLVIDKTCQLFFTGTEIYKRSGTAVSGGTYPNWNDWSNVADSGNADTLDGLHANEIANNPNLLINPDFAVNQRGKTSYTVTDYTVDMWRSQSFFTISALSNGIEISCAKSITTNYIAFVQDVPVSDSMIGNDLILSLNLSSTNDYAYATIHVYSDSNTIVHSSAKVKIGVGMNYIPVSSIPDTAAYIRVQITINAGAEIGDSIIINWAKLEMGRIATPFTPPDPAIELAKCQRYFYALPYGSERLSGFAFSTTTGYLMLPLPTAMRDTPTVTRSDKQPAKLAVANGENTQIVDTFTVNVTPLGLLYTVTGTFSRAGQILSAYHAAGDDGGRYPTYISAEL